MAKKFNVEYTNKDIMDKLQELDTKINSIHDQTLKTNGRVNTIETQQTNNVAAFNREKDAFAKRMECVEQDSKVLSWKVAGLCATAGIVSAVITMILGKLI